MPKVLIADDEKALLLSLETGLKVYRDRFEVIFAHNGKEAMEVIKSENVDLLITDLKMPKMNGFELIASVSSDFPHISCIVMTAFNTPEIENRLLETPMIKLIEKPVDFDELTAVILETLESRLKGVSLPGISLSNYLQLLSMESKTCVIEIQGPNQSKGLLYFKNGDLLDGEFKNLKGENAVMQLLKIKEPKILFKNPLSNGSGKKRIKNGLMGILLNLAKDMDEKTDENQDFGFDIEDVEPPDTIEDENQDNNTVVQHNTNHKLGDQQMTELEVILEKFKVVSGFLAVGAFSPNGEIVAELNTSGIKLAEIGALANDVLLKAQKATEIMEVGRGKMVHIEAPKAHIIARCHNESNEYSSTEGGKAHVHMVAILKADGNLAMAKMKMETVVAETAPFFR